LGFFVFYRKEFAMIPLARPDHNIPSQVYDRYRLAYNNVTYRAVHDALEECAALDNRDDRHITEAFITDTMNLLIDASFARLGTTLYQDAEAKLLDKLRPLDSYLRGLAQRHLSNFGISPIAARPTPLHRLTHELSITRADLSAAEQDARRQDGYKADVAAEWLKVGQLFIGAATDLLTDTHTPGVVWRRSADEKLSAALVALHDGLKVMLDEDYTMPPSLSQTLQQLRDLFPPSPETPET